MARKIVTFTGNNGAGAISVSGVEAGDQILAVMFTSGGVPVGQPAANFAQFVIVDDEVLQFSSDYSIYTFAALIERKVMLT